jgi:hypothetical protein
MEHKECSETLAIKLHTPDNNPKENIRQTCTSVSFVHHKSGLVWNPCPHGERPVTNRLRLGKGVGEIAFRRAPYNP